MRKIKRVYFAHLYRNDPEYNRDIVKTYCTILSERYPHINIFAPHLYLYQLGIQDTEGEYNRAMEICLDELARSDEMWIGSKISEGIKQEIDLCNGYSTINNNNRIVYSFVRIIIPTKEIIYSNSSKVFDVPEKDIMQWDFTKFYE